MRRPAALLVALAVALASQALAAGRPRVVVLRTSEAAPFAAASSALAEVLGDRVDLLETSIDPDAAEEAARIAALEAAVLVPLGSQAARWTQSDTETTPIVFAMVLYPVQTGIVPSLEHPGGRITGAALDIPIALQFRALREVVGAERVAVLYDPSETGPLVERARAQARAQGIELLGIEVWDPGNLDRSLDEIDREIDALWSVADRTVMTRIATQRILLHTLRERIPFLGLSEQFVRAGALLALVSSYAANGRQAAHLVHSVLDGRPPAQLPVAVPDQIEVVLNDRTARRLRFSPPADAFLPIRTLR